MEAAYKAKYYPEDSWVKSDTSERLVSPPPQGFEHARVVLLMDVHGKYSDVVIIQQLLLPCEAELVLDMPFPNLEVPDRPIWKRS
ncbi:hypothetical protein LIER_07794 [Lithospermum erythrorhizon]|uniref:Uncharacterized protein n=1 Tax=Lithospermum erythrorhizon TaxID=34254 RepID=A0AAV3PE41_LITER